MRPLGLFLSGRFEDAFLYMGYIIALTEEKTIRTYNLERITSQLEADYPDLVPIPTLLFSRNNWWSNQRVAWLAREPVDVSTAQTPAPLGIVTC